MPDNAPLYDPDVPEAPPGWLVTATRAAEPALPPAPDWQPLTGGRSNRLWRVGELVVKLYDPASETPLFPNDPPAEAAALRTFAPLGLAPRLQAEGSGWIAYDHVPGRVWQSDPRPVAETLGRLHRLPAASGPFRHLPSGAAALRDQGVAIAAACRGNLPPPPDIADPGPAPVTCNLHGDAVPGNLIIGPHWPVLIDWQCPANGDAAEDIAAFLSPAMQWLYRGKPLAADETQAFVAACPDPGPVARYRALAPLFHWRMAAHCLWKAERGAADYAQALELELAAIRP